MFSLYERKHIIPHSTLYFIKIINFNKRSKEKKMLLLFITLQPVLGYKFQLLKFLSYLDF